MTDATSPPNPDRPGPLSGLRVIEMAAIGPVPFAGMLMADLGADVVRIDRLTPSDLGVPGAVVYAPKVLRRGDGVPAYNLAVVVDDAVKKVEMLHQLPPRLPPPRHHPPTPPAWLPTSTRVGRS
jgi:hypothetical protein